MTPSRLYRIASLLLALFAVGHTVGFLQTDPSWGVDSLLAAMKSTRFHLQGFDRTYWEFYVGFGLLWTVALLFFAFLSWQIGRLMPGMAIPLRPIRWALAVCSVLVACLSWGLFFVAPGVLSTASAICLVAAAMPDWRARQAGSPNSRSGDSVNR